MTRGQITIPAEIRRRLDINEDSWLWVKLVKNKIIVELMDKQEETIEDYLAEAETDNNAYWFKDEEDEYLAKMDRKSKKKLEDMNK